MDTNRDILWIGEGHSPPPNVRQAAQGWNLHSACAGQPLAEQLWAAPVTIVYPNGSAGDTERLAAMLSQLGQSHSVAIFLLPPDDRRPWTQIAQCNGPFQCVANDASPGEIAARLSAAAEMAPALSTLRKELASARDKSSGRQRLIEEMDEEMRLAARLQRDFLPRRLPELGPARFGVLYRPATWVSGDIYDILRLDETHVGFYVADVVGHGMPAALLTMFIKKALQTKRITGSSYQIVPPETAMTELNADICDQNLSSCQFCTAVYAVLDTATMELTYSRAGHPEPLLMHRKTDFGIRDSGLGVLDTRMGGKEGGVAQRLDCPGSLLGVFPEAQFTARTIQLEPGQRLLFYSDGLEEAVRPADRPRETKLEELLDSFLLRPRDEMLLRISEQMDVYRGEKPLSDDVTALVLDIE